MEVFKLTESQWRLSIIALAGAFFQIMCLYIFHYSTNSTTPLPSPSLYLLYIPATFCGYILYYKIFT